MCGTYFFKDIVEEAKKHHKNKPVQETTHRKNKYQNPTNVTHPVCQVLDRMATLPSTSQAPVYCPGPEWRPWLRTPSWPTHASLMEICLKYPPWLWLWEWPLSWMPERLEMISRCLSLPFVSGLSSLVTYFAWTTGPITTPILIKWWYNEAVTHSLTMSPKYFYCFIVTM